MSSMSGMPEYDDRRYLEYRHNHRFALIRRAVIYVPGAVALTSLLVWAALGLPSTVVIVIFLSVGALAIDIEAYQSLRDLSASPVTSRGLVQRKWSKGRFLFFGRVHYLLVSTRGVDMPPDTKPKDRLFEVGPIAARELDLGDEVEILHWPHTNTVITLERVGSRR